MRSIPIILSEISLFFHRCTDYTIFLNHNIFYSWSGHSHCNCLTSSDLQYTRLAPNNWRLYTWNSPDFRLQPLFQLLPSRRRDGRPPGETTLYCMPFLREFSNFKQPISQTTPFHPKPPYSNLFPFLPSNRNPNNLSHRTPSGSAITHFPPQITQTCTNKAPIRFKKALTTAQPCQFPPLNSTKSRQAQIKWCLPEKGYSCRIYRFRTAWHNKRSQNSYIGISSLQKCGTDTFSTDTPCISLGLTKPEVCCWVDRVISSSDSRYFWQVMGSFPIIWSEISIFLTHALITLCSIVITYFIRGLDTCTVIVPLQAICSTPG